MHKEQGYDGTWHLSHSSTKRVTPYSSLVDVAWSCLERPQSVKAYDDSDVGHRAATRMAVMKVSIIKS